ncbi:MAG TPA: hypothetical protein VGK94_13975 [Candidatus Polarisedimenticolia bacterium]
MRERGLTWPSALLGVAMTAAIAAGCSSRSPIPEGAELIPSDATFAISVDLPAIQNSELYRKLQSDERFFGSNRLNFLKFAAATGLDPSKDIRRLLFMARAGDEGLEEMSGIVIGAFDGRKVHDFLADSGLPKRQVAGIDVFEFLVIEDRCRFCLAVLDSSTAAFGDGETLTKIAQVKGGTAPGLAGEERAARLLRRIARGSEAWGILRADDLRETLSGILKRVSADAGALARLGPIHEASFSFDTAEPMRAVIEFTATSSEDAMLVADVLKGAESLGRLAIKEAKPEFARLMSDMLIEADGGIVRVSTSIPQADIETVTRLLGGDWLAQRLKSPSD